MPSAWRYAAVFFALSTALALHAQEGSPAATAPTLRVSTQLVVLDVVVTDKKGHVIDHGLTKDDFTVMDSGARERLRHFETPDDHKMPAAATAIVHSAADLSRIGDAPVTILVLDELNSRFEDMSYSRQMLVKYLQRQPAVLPQPTVLMVASNTTFQQIHDYTQDRDALVAAVKKHMPEFPYKQGARTGAAAVERMAQVLSALQQISESSTGTPGRKNLIWVGNGFPTANFAGLDDATVAQLERALHRVTTRLMAARITMYSIDPTPGTTTTVDVEDPDDLNLATNEYSGDPFGNGGASFQELAPNTGGTAFTGRNDIENVIGEGIAKGRDYYTLSYVPTALHTAKPLDYRGVKVLMRDPNLRATTRMGYYTESANDLNPVLDKSLSFKDVRANLQLDLSNALTTTITYNGLDVTAQPDGKGNYTIHVAANRIGWSDATAGGAQGAEATVAAGWYDRKGKLLGHIAREEVYPHRAPEAVYTLPISLPPGAVRLRFLVRDTRNGHMGTVDITKF